MYTRLCFSFHTQIQNNHLGEDKSRYMVESSQQNEFSSNLILSSSSNDLWFFLYECTPTLSNVHWMQNTPVNDNSPEYGWWILSPPSTRPHLNHHAAWHPSWWSHDPLPLHDHSHITTQTPQAQEVDPRGAPTPHQACLIDWCHKNLLPCKWPLLLQELPLTHLSWADHVTSDMVCSLQWIWTKLHDHHYNGCLCLVGFCRAYGFSHKKWIWCLSIFQAGGAVAIHAWTQRHSLYLIGTWELTLLACHFLWHCRRSSSWWDNPSACGHDLAWCSCNLWSQSPSHHSPPHLFCTHPPHF